MTAPQTPEALVSMDGHETPCSGGGGYVYVGPDREDLSGDPRSTNSNETRVEGH
jgi:hypothetical protein